MCMVLVTVVQPCNRVTVYNPISFLSYTIIYLFLLAIKVGEEVVVEPSRSIVKSKLLVNAIDLL